MSACESRKYRGESVSKLEQLSKKLGSGAFAVERTPSCKIAALIIGLISETQLIYMKGYGTEQNVLALLSRGRDDSIESVAEVYSLVKTFITPHLDSILGVFKELEMSEEFDLLKRSLEVLQEKEAAIYAYEEQELAHAAIRPR